MVPRHQLHAAAVAAAREVRRQVGEQPCQQQRRRDAHGRHPPLVAVREHVVQQRQEVVELRLGHAGFGERDVGQGCAHQFCAVVRREALKEVDDKVAHAGLDRKRHVFVRPPHRDRLRHDREPERRAGCVGLGALLKGLQDVFELRVGDRPPLEAQEVLQDGVGLRDRPHLDTVAVMAVVAVEAAGAVGQLRPQDRQALELSVVRQRRHHEPDVRRQARHGQPVEPASAVGVVELVHRVDEEREGLVRRRPLGHGPLEVGDELLEVGWHRVVLRVHAPKLRAQTGEQRVHVGGACRGAEEADHDGPVCSSRP